MLTTKAKAPGNLTVVGREGAGGDIETGVYWQDRIIPQPDRSNNPLSIRSVEIDPDVVLMDLVGRHRVRLRNTTHQRRPRIAR